MIEVFDNVLMEDTREGLYMFSTTTDYQIGWGDVSTFETRQYPCLHHTLTKKEWQNSKFMESICSGGLIQSLDRLVFDLLKTITNYFLTHYHTYASMQVCIKQISNLLKFLKLCLIKLV